MKIDAGTLANYRVVIVDDSDGAAGTSGTVIREFESGRRLVELDCGGTRNLSSDVIVKQ
jgi:hypothetical protein